MRDKGSFSKWHDGPHLLEMRCDHQSWSASMSTDKASAAGVPPGPLVAADGASSAFTAAGQPVVTRSSGLRDSWDGANVGSRIFAPSESAKLEIAEAEGHVPKRHDRRT